MAEIATSQPYVAKPISVPRLRKRCCQGKARGGDLPRQGARYPKADLALADAAIVSRPSSVSALGLSSVDRFAGLVMRLAKLITNDGYQSL